METAKLLQPISLIPNPPEPHPGLVTRLGGQSSASQPNPPEAQPAKRVEQNQSDADLAFQPDDHSAFGLVELTLKKPDRLDRLVRDDARQAELITQFLAIALVGFTIFGVAATVVLNTAGQWPTGVPAAGWGSRSVANLILAYDLGMVAATGVCLPSFYFYGLLAGVKTSMLQVVAHAMKGTATTAITLVGILPIYVAVVLGMIVFGASPDYTRLTLYVALALPFIAGLWGVWTLYVGFTGLVDTMTPERQCRRGCLLRRLVVAWSVCYTAVSPLMIYTLWHRFSA